MASVEIPSKVLSALHPFPDQVDNITLGVSTAESYTVPTGVKAILVSGTAPFFVRLGGTADDTPGDLTNGTGSMPISSVMEFKVSPGQVLSFISAAATIIGIGRYYSP